MQYRVGGMGLWVVAWLFMVVHMGCSPTVTEPAVATEASASATSAQSTAPSASASNVPVEVVDAYRKYEAIESPEVLQWVAEKNKVTRGVLNSLPSRHHFAKAVRKYVDVPYITSPVKMRTHYYYHRKDPGKNTTVLVRARQIGVGEQVVLDANEWSADGSVTLAGWAISHTEKHLAYGVAHGGSDWRSWRVLDLHTLKPLKDEIRGLKWGRPAWAPGDIGLFYSGYPDRSHSETAKGTGNRLYYHKLGTKQSADPVIYQPQNEKWMASIDVFETQDLAEVYLYKSSDGNGRIELFPLGPDWRADPVAAFKAPSKHVISPDFGWRQWVVGGAEGVVHLFSEKDAPLGQIQRYSIKDKSLTTIVPQRKETLVTVGQVGKLLFGYYLEDVSAFLVVYDFNGRQLDEIRMPFPASIWGLSHGRSWRKEALFGTEGYATPESIHRYSFATKKLDQIWSLKTDFKSQDYVSKRVFYAASDGTKIPMFIVHHKSVKRDGKNRTLLYGYGCYGYLKSIDFTSSLVPWLQRGGVYAVANIRGGGAYGNAWHRAAQGKKKQTSIDDFIAAAEWLQAEGYASRSTLSIRGGSCGGLLVGACATQRPELYAAVVAEVGIYDLLRYHKFSGAYLWEDELGSPDEPEQRKWLAKLSPLLRAQKKQHYPAMLITTRKKDTRVTPMNSYKFAAALQDHQQGDKPILLRVDEIGGHGLAGMSLDERIKYLADVYAFAWDSAAPQP